MAKTVEMHGLAEPNHSSLERFDLAAGLLCAGVTPLSMEGLSDDTVRAGLATVGAEDVCPYAEQHVMDPEKQIAMLHALRAGDSGMWERAADAGLFSQLIGGGHEV